MSLASRIRQSRVASGKPQRLIAEALGVSVQAVSQWENAQAVIQPDRIAALADALGVSREWLEHGDKGGFSVRDEPDQFNLAAQYKSEGIYVHKLSDFARFLLSFDNNTKTLDASYANEVIHINPNFVLKPIAIMIDKDDLAPDLRSGDIAIFDMGQKVRDGDFVAALMSHSGFFHMDQKGQPTGSYQPAIFQFVASPENRSRRRILTVDPVPPAGTGSEPAVMIIGPLVERRSYFRRSSESLDNEIK